LFNAENVARYAPAAWHSADSVIDTSYEALDEIAKQKLPVKSSFDASNSIQEPELMTEPPASLNISKPNASKAQGRDVWLVHPWSLGDLPADIAKDTLVIGVYLFEFHRDWPWDERRWLFVQNRMNELASACWFGDALSIAAALEGATRVRGVMEAHIASLLPAVGQFSPVPALFDEVDRRCDSFSKWWNVVAR
jgi:deoxyribodipyrimidine photo-lyase